MKWIKHIVVSLAILVGLVFTFNEQIAKVIMDREVSITPEMTRSASRISPKMEEAEVTTLTPADVMRTKLTRNLDNLYLGYVYIPSIGLKQPVINELSNASLIMGAAIIYEGMSMGEDNYVIASHFSYLSENHLFSPLYYNKNQGASCQLIYLTDLDKVYIYTTTFFEVVDPSETEYIQRGTNNPKITLYTCNYNNYDGRIVLQGELKDVVSINDLPSEILNEIL